ncbi:MAG: ABC transporter ATP-binding protein [Treponemataceae bacterium]|nr:ABC transporter ATP-binding protein [Treponemataceae bacterium]
MIEMKNIVSGHKDYLQIENLSFADGQITALAGQNGSGKSTLLKTILGLIKSKGEITLDGEQLSSLSHKERAKKIAYFPQVLRTTTMDVRTLVSHGRFSHIGFSSHLSKIDEELIENAIEIADLQNLCEKNLSELSGGERQRAYLAMIIAQNSKMILLDEPMTYMDVNHQIKMQEILLKLKKEGRGIVLASHDLPQVFSFCDRICLMKEGRILCNEEPSTLSEKKDFMRSILGFSIEKNMRLNSDKKQGEFLYDYNLCK